MTRYVLATPDEGFAQRATEHLDDGEVSQVPDQVLLMSADHAVDAIAEQAGDHPAVVAIGPQMPEEAALRMAEAFDERRPDISVVLVTTPHDQLTAQAMRAGVRDVLGPDVEGEELGKTLARAAEVARRRRGHTGDERPSGRVLVVSSSKGGSGKTTVATNLATTLAERRPDGVCLIDLDVQFGDVATCLQLMPEASLGDALSPSRLDPTSLKVLLTHHRSGLYVLAAPPSPAAGEEITPELVQQVVRLLAQEFGHVVIDTSPGLSELTLAAIEESSDLIFVVGMDVPSVHGFRKTLHALDAIGMTHQARHVVLNRADARVALAPEDVARTIGMDVHVRMPSSRDVPLALNQGLPLSEANPRSPAAKAIGELAERFVAQPAERRSGGLLSRMKGS